MAACEFIDKLHASRFKGIHFAAPDHSSRITETQLVRCVLQMLQGFPSSLLVWDENQKKFAFNSGAHVQHYSISATQNVLKRFVRAGSCLKLVEDFVRVVGLVECPPTLSTFANSVSMKLRSLRKVPLRVEEEVVGSEEGGSKTTLMWIVEELKSMCAGAEYLLQIVQEAVPEKFLQPCSFPACEIAVYILDYLYTSMEEICLVQDGEEEAYHTLLTLFLASLQPLLQSLDSWLYEGILDDPYNEMFFYANGSTTIQDATFWRNSYLLRTLVSETFTRSDTTASSAAQVADWDSDLQRSSNVPLHVSCPLFLQGIAKAVVSAGKSFQLVQHTPLEQSVSTGNDQVNEILSSRESRSFLIFDDRLPDNSFDIEPANEVKHTLCGQGIGGFTLSEVFCVSFVALVDDGTCICRFFKEEYPWSQEIALICNQYMKEKLEYKTSETDISSRNSEKLWCKFFVDTVLQKIGHVDIPKNSDHNSEKVSCLDTGGDKVDIDFIKRLWPRNPSISLCLSLLSKNSTLWDDLSSSKGWFLPPLNDWFLRSSIYGENRDEFKGVDYHSGFGLLKPEKNRYAEAMEELFPFPTLLPCYQGKDSVVGLLPYQKSSTVASRVFNWTLNHELKMQLLPAVIIQECLSIYIEKQVHYIGKLTLSKLMNTWRLMDELSVLQAIFLLGSGDLLQHFSTILFKKLDDGVPCDDYFELNALLQESIRNSADGGLLANSDSLVVDLANYQNITGEDRARNTTISNLLVSRSLFFGINALDMLQFSYKVSWPLEIIANHDAMKKYNQVMAFLLKVKRAKFVLDKTRRWVWMDRSTRNVKRKNHLLPQQKLLHFVDVFHHYVMDRVIHNAWLELEEGIASAGSLDEVIEVHEAYLVSIQRQCFVSSDKLLALIGSRIKIILGLALDFHSIERSLFSGGVAPAIKRRCEMEVDNIEKQYDECIAFLLKVLSSKTNIGHFPHLADLVTRINYNNYYMSDDGSLLMVPGLQNQVYQIKQIG